MLLMEAVETRLGSMKTWPTAILTLIFTYDPLTLNASQKLETFVAFFFGNDIPLNTACQFFIACNAHSYAHLKEQFHHLYGIWSQSPSRSSRPKSHYYNMRERKFMYTDGSYMFAFNNITLDTGFSGTGFPTLIHTVLRRVSQLGLAEEE
jgi:hypothetical protein